MDTNRTRRALLRRLATVGGASALTTVGITDAANDSENSARLLYTCDITTDGGLTPKVNDRIHLRRAEGTFGPTKAECFEGKELLYRYLFAALGGRSHRREGIAWTTRRRLPTGTYRIATIFVCDDAPSGYCAFKPFYGIMVRRVGSE